MGTLGHDWAVITNSFPIFSKAKWLQHLTWWKSRTSSTRETGSQVGSWGIQLRMETRQMVTTQALLSQTAPVFVLLPGAAVLKTPGSWKTTLHTFSWSLWNRAVVCYDAWRALGRWVFLIRKLVQLLMVPLGAERKSKFLSAVTSTHCRNFLHIETFVKCSIISSQPAS